MAVQKNENKEQQFDVKKNISQSRQSISKKAQSSSGIISTIFTWFTIFFLSLILLSLFLVIAILFDFLGIIKIRDLLPQSLLEHPYVKEYIRESTIIKSSEESKIKALIYEQETSYKDMMDKLKHKEIMIEEQTLKLAQWEKELRERELEIISKQKELQIQIKEFEELKKQKNISDQTIEQFAKMYERMEPQIAAEALNSVENELLLEILSKMKDKRSAAILEKLPPDKVAQITTLIKQIKNNQNNKTPLNNENKK